MSTTKYRLWCFVEEDNTYFPVVASSTISIGELKYLIKQNRGDGLPVDAIYLTLLKVDVNVDDAVEAQICAGQYRLNANDQQPLRITKLISEVWPESPPNDRLHVYVIPPAGHGVVSSGSSTLYDAANRLYTAMWQQDLGSKLQDVDQCEGFKYLPATVVNELRLRELKCNAMAILVREEYRSTLDTLEARQNIGGMVVMGHPGIGKSVFIFYTLLHHLGKGQPVALQCDDVVLIFRQDGVKIHEADSDGLFFRSEEKLWALVDSSETNSHVCRAFQRASQMGRAWLVLATSPARKRYDRLRKECSVGVFVMDYFTREESRALSIIHGLDVERFLENYDEWGPSTRTCLGLARGTITEDELEDKVAKVAKKFAENPRAIFMEEDSEDGSHWLFTSVPSGGRRDVPVLQVATPNLKEFVMEAISRTNATQQVSFYAEASSYPFFRSEFGYIFENYFYRWLASDPYNKIPCTAWPRSTGSTEATRSTAHEQDQQVELHRLQPVGLDKVIVHGGDADARGYKSANEYRTPFSWIPASRLDAAFDAVICTDTNIITIQVTNAAEQSIKEKGIQSLVKNLPNEYRKARSWCHVFVTDYHDNATKLGKAKYPIADKMNISIHTAVLDISLFPYPPHILACASIPSFESVGMEIDAEGW